MKERFLGILVCIIALTTFTSCSFHTAPDIASDDPTDGQIVFSGWGPHMFERIFDSKGEHADEIIETLLTATQEDNKELIKSLFSPYVIESVSEAELDIQINGFCENFKGNLTEYDEIASINSQRKNDAIATNCFEGTYSVQTTECEYLLAIKLVTKDTADANEAGIHSVYIIEEEAHNSEFAYWGGNVWEPGIWVE